MGLMPELVSQLGILDHVAVPGAREPDRRGSRPTYTSTSYTIPSSKTAPGWRLLGVRLRARRRLLDTSRLRYRRRKSRFIKNVLFNTEQMESHADASRARVM